MQAETDGQVTGGGGGFINLISGILGNLGTNAYVSLKGGAELSFTLDEDILGEPSSAVAGTEFPLTITTAATDADGSETLSITVGGLPEGVTLSAGTDNGDGTYTLTAGQLSGLTMFVPATVTEQFALQVSSTSTENDGDSETTSVSVSLDGQDVTAESPTLAAADAAGNEDAAIALDIDAALTDLDGSETLSIR